MKHVILGNGAAALTAATKIREIQKDDEIIVISSEETPVYSKPMLPDYIGGKLSKEKLFLKKFEFYKENSIELVLGNKVQRVDTIGRTVLLSNERLINYDRLLISIGGVPVTPAIEGLSDTEYFTLNSVQDADALKARAFKDGKVVIIGAGLTGMEVGFALKRLGMEVTILERYQHILPMQLDTSSSGLIREYIEREGIGVLFSKSITKVFHDKKVLLSEGEYIDYDMLVMAIGTMPNIQAIKDSRIKCNRGILVNRFMETSEKDVYAAGDVAELTDNISGEFVPTYIWSNAMAQGKCAAYNMVGIRQEFSTLSALQNSVQMRDIPFISMGISNPKEEGFEILIHHDKHSGIYKKIILKENIVRGMVFIGDINSSRAISNLIRKGTDVSNFKSKLFEGNF